MAARRRPARRLRLVRPLAGDPGHDQRVPVVLVRARRPARARDRAAVHACSRSRSRCRSRCRARAGTCCGARSAEALAAALAIGSLYAINSWSYPVAAGLLAAAVVVWLRDARRRPARLPARVARRSCWSASFVLILPFVLNFDPEARGIGIVARRARPFGKWLGDMALIYGILALAAGRPRSRRRLLERAEPLALARLGRSRRRRRRLAAGRPRPDRRDGRSRSRWSSGSAPRCRRELRAPQRFLWVLVAGGVGAAADPGVALPARRVRQRRAGAHEHGLQGRLPGVPAARARGRLRAAVGGRRGCRAGRWTGWAAVAAVLLLLGLVYPYAGGYARTGGYPNAPTLDGLKWLRVTLARRPGRDRLAAREHAGRRGRAGGRRRRLLRVRPRAASRPSPAARP